MHHTLKRYCFLGGLLGLLLIATLAFAGQLSVWKNPGGAATAELTANETVTASGQRGAYVGNFRVYVVEPEARWKDDSNSLYHYGFIGFAVDEDIILTDQPYTNSVIWDADDYTPAYILSETNLEVIGVVFSSQGHEQFSDPPSGYPFMAYYTDACAAADPDHPGSNTTAGGFTHTVFMEEGTAPWCPSCPNANTVMYTIKHNMGLNFHYAAMVIDGEYGGPESPADVYSRLDELNLHWLPTVYTDGGFELLSSTALYTQPYVDMINDAGARAVPDLSLDVSMTYLGGNAIQVDYTITYNGWTNSAPDDPAAPSGNMVECAAGESYDFAAAGFDSDYQDVYMRWDYGDGTISDWYGPFENDETCVVNYAWAAGGVYPVKAQVKDAMDVESNWSDPLNVEVYMCGDVDDNSNVNILDIIFLIDYKFKGGDAPRIMNCGDANSDGAVNILDIIALIDYKFKSGPAPDCP